MRVRRVVASAAAAGAMLFAGQVVASANIAWCVDDPPVQVQTASGSTLTVNTQVSAPKDQVHLLKQVIETTSTTPDATGTLITITVTIPAGITTARVVASVNSAGVSASTTGVGGQTVTLYLDVPKS